MHNAKCFLTCGVDSTIPLELQLFLWECVDSMPVPRDYLQVFELKPVGILQAVIHSSEEPAYKMEYVIPKKTEMDYITSCFSDLFGTDKEE